MFIRVAKRLKRETNKGEIHNSNRKARGQNSIETSYKGGQPRIKISWPHKNYYFFDSLKKKKTKWCLSLALIKFRYEERGKLHPEPNWSRSRQSSFSTVKINQLINLFTESQFKNLSKTDLQFGVSCKSKAVMKQSRNVSHVQTSKGLVRVRDGAD